MVLKDYRMLDTFSFRTDSALAMLYSTSVMEHHHFDHCIMILNSTVRCKIYHLYFSIKMTMIVCCKMR